MTPVGMRVVHFPGSLSLGDGAKAAGFADATPTSTKLIDSETRPPSEV